MQVGFAIKAAGVEVTSQSFGPPQAVQALVSAARFGGRHAVLLGRLYHRQELIAALGDSLPGELEQEAAANPAALALAAYLAQGAAGLARLEGDFAAVVWDSTISRLLGVRDPLGGYPLFWTQSGGTIGLGTSLRPLLEGLSGRALDLEYVADHLMLPGCGFQEPPVERTPFRGVRRVRPGNVVSFGVPDGEPHTEWVWHWTDNLPDPGTDRLEDLAGQYRELLRLAVRTRLEDQTACELSGGMDSSSIALLASEQIAARGGTAPLHTLSLVYESLPGLARETAYLDAVLAGRSGMQAHRIVADRLLNYDGFCDPPPHDEPCPGLGGLATNQAIIERAAEGRAGVVLTGHGADELNDLMPFHLADLVRSGRLRAASREAARWARAENVRAVEVLWRWGLAPLLPAWLRLGVGHWLRGGRANWERQTDYTVPPWVLPGFAHRHDLRGRAVDHLRRADAAGPSTQLARLVAQLDTRVGDTARWALAAPLGLTVAHPFLDTRLLRFGLGVWTRLRPEPGRLKPLLADAMRGILPDIIRDRRHKGNFNEVHFVGLSRNLPRLEALVQEAPLDGLGLFDRGELLRCLHKAALGVASEAAGMDRLNLTLTLLAWLTRHEHWLRTPVPEVSWDSWGRAGQRPAVVVGGVHAP